MFNDPINLNEFASTYAPIEPSYVYSEEVKRKPKLHTLLGRATVPARAEYQNNEKELRRSFVEEISDLNRRNYATIRLSILVNGNLVDCLIVGKRDRLDNGRWILNSLPNLKCLEEAIADSSHIDRLKKLRANAIYFNYPGVGCSEGLPHQSDMIATYHALLRYLENNIGAREILMFGTSIGGGVQGAALHNYAFREGIKYLSIIDQSFNALNNVPTDFVKEAAPEFMSPRAKKFVPDSMSRLAASCLKKGGWTLESVSSAVQLERKGIHQIIIQNSHEITEHLTNPDAFIGDGVIARNASLGKTLLDPAFMESQSIDSWSTKRFLGVTAAHAWGYSDEEEQMIRDAIRSELEISIPYGRGLGGEVLRDATSSSESTSSSSSSFPTSSISGMMVDEDETDYSEHDSFNTDDYTLTSSSSSSSSEPDTSPRIEINGNKTIKRSSVDTYIEE